MRFTPHVETQLIVANCTSIVAAERIVLRLNCYFLQHRQSAHLTHCFVERGEGKDPRSHHDGRDNWYRMCSDSRWAAKSDEEQRLSIHGKACVRVADARNVSVQAREIE